MGWLTAHDWLLQVHNDQLTHVRRGCLARPHQDIPSDRSRIEGSHKGWNSLQRAQLSGIEVLSGLTHDFVLRRNLRVATSHPQNSSTFALSPFDSHHIRLCNHVAQLFNTLAAQDTGLGHCALNPVLTLVDSGEIFGLVPSNHAKSFGSLIVITEDEDAGILNDPDLQADPIDVAQEMNIDPVLLSLPQDMSTTSHTPLGLLISQEGVQEKRKLSDDMANTNNDLAQAKRPRHGDGTFTTDAKLVHTIFKPHQPASKAPNDDITIEQLPLPVGSSPLTRSQLIFSLATRINPHALTIQTGHEFFLFMDMHAEHQWASFKMTSHKWVLATEAYNKQL